VTRLAPLLLLLAAPAERPEPPCEALVPEVAAGRTPLAGLVARCKPEHVARAALTATSRLDVSGFATGRLEGEILVPQTLDAIRASWQGTCLARLPEALPSAGGMPPAQCLEQATLREVQERRPAEDERAQELNTSPNLLERGARA